MSGSELSQRAETPKSSQYLGLSSAKDPSRITLFKSTPTKKSNNDGHNDIVDNNINGLPSSELTPSYSSQGEGQTNRLMSLLKSKNQKPVSSSAETPSKAPDVPKHINDVPKLKKTGPEPRPTTSFHRQLSNWVSYAGPQSNFIPNPFSSNAQNSRATYVIAPSNQPTINQTSATNGMPRPFLPAFPGPSAPVTPGGFAPPGQGFHPSSNQLPTLKNGVMLPAPLGMIPNSVAVPEASVHKRAADTDINKSNGNESSTLQPVPHTARQNSKSLDHSRDSQLLSESSSKDKVIPDPSPGKSSSALEELHHSDISTTSPTIQESSLSTTTTKPRSQSGPPSGKNSKKRFSLKRSASGNVSALARTASKRQKLSSSDPVFGQKRLLTADPSLPTATQLRLLADTPFSRTIYDQKLSSFSTENVERIVQQMHSSLPGVATSATRASSRPQPTPEREEEHLSGVQSQMKLSSTPSDKSKDESHNSTLAEATDKINDQAVKTTKERHESENVPVVKQEDNDTFLASVSKEARSSSLQAVSSQRGELQSPSTQKGATAVSSQRVSKLPLSATSHIVIPLGLTETREENSIINTNVPGSYLGLRTHQTSNKTPIVDDSRSINDSAGYEELAPRGSEINSNALAKQDLHEGESSSEPKERQTVPSVAHKTSPTAPSRELVIADIALPAEIPGKSAPIKSMVESLQDPQKGPGESREKSQSPRAGLVSQGYAQRNTSSVSEAVSNTNEDYVPFRASNDEDRPVQSSVNLAQQITSDGHLNGTKEPSKSDIPGVNFKLRPAFQSMSKRRATKAVDPLKPLPESVVSPAVSSEYGLNGEDKGPMFPGSIGKTGNAPILTSDDGPANESDHISSGISDISSDSFDMDKHSVSRKSIKSFEDWNRVPGAQVGQVAPRVSPLSVSRPRKFQDPEAGRKQIEKIVARQITRKMSSVKNIQKQLLIHLSQAGVVTHTPFSSGPAVTSSNNICNINNYEMSPVLYLQQLSKRGRLETTEFTKSKLHIIDFTQKDGHLENADELRNACDGLKVFIDTFHFDTLDAEGKALVKWRSESLKHAFSTLNIKLTDTMSSDVSVIIAISEVKNPDERITVDATEAFGLQAWSYGYAVRFFQHLLGVDAISLEPPITGSQKKLGTPSASMSKISSGSRTGSPDQNNAKNTAEKCSEVTSDNQSDAIIEGAARVEGKKNTTSGSNIEDTGSTERPEPQENKNQFELYDKSALKIEGLLRELFSRTSDAAIDKTAVRMTAADICTEVANLLEKQYSTKEIVKRKLKHSDRIISAMSTEILNDQMKIASLHGRAVSKEKEVENLKRELREERMRSERQRLNHEQLLRKNDDGMMPTELRGSSIVEQTNVFEHVQPLERPLQASFDDNDVLDSRVVEDLGLIKNALGRGGSPSGTPAPGPEQPNPFELNHALRPSSKPTKNNHSTPSEISQKVGIDDASTELVSSVATLNEKYEKLNEVCKDMLHIIKDERSSFESQLSEQKSEAEEYKHQLNTIQVLLEREKTKRKAAQAKLRKFAHGLFSDEEDDGEDSEVPLASLRIT